MRIDRIERLADLLKKDNINAVLIGPSPDLEYLTGLTPSADERFKGLFILCDGSFLHLPFPLFWKPSMGNDADICMA